MSVGSDPANLLAGVPWGKVEPPQPPPPLPMADARSWALRKLRQYFSLCDFSRKGKELDGSDAVVYRVPIAHIFTDAPDEPTNLAMPALSFIPGEGLPDPYGLGPGKIDEETADVYAPGMVLLEKHDYVEKFIVEVWAGTRAERRSLVAGVTAALTAEDDSYSVDLKLPEYYDRIARFSYMGHRSIDDADVIKGRRRAHVMVELRVPEVQLVYYRRIRATVEVEVCETAYEAQIALEAKLKAQQAPQT